jgi:nitroreductase
VRNWRRGRPARPTAYDLDVDTFLTIASKRDTRRYADRAIPEDVVERILIAGRVAGSARNRQPWRFLVVESADRRDKLAEAVYAPTNVHGAQLVVAIVGSSGLDGGRCLQNMMLAAWNDGVASCPNGIADADRARVALDLGEDDTLAVVLTFGYPATGRTGDSRSAAEWLSGADRKPLDELVERV